MKSQCPKQLISLAMHLLDMANEEFGNHGCNDFDLEAIMPDADDRRALMKAYHEWNGDPEEFYPENLYKGTQDFMLMGYLARNLGNIVAQVQKDALEEGFEIAACFAEANPDEIWRGRGRDIDMSNARVQLKKRLDEIKINKK